MIKRLVQCVREYKKPAILSPVLVTFEVIIDCIIPFLVASLVNEIKAGCALSVIVKYGTVLIILALFSLFFVDFCKNI